MPKHHILIEKEFESSLPEVFQAICDHENFGKLIGAKIVRTKDGEDGITNGLGSIRKIVASPLPSFEETVTNYQENQYFEYKITKGSPIKNHIGKLTFSSTHDKTLLRYTIDFDMKLPIPLLGTGLAKVLKSQISSGLNKIK
ncbi:SRPBCC family protein [Litoribrevibacter euphylliae]|uniref:SRPBCC family protein n=1 Tax=Litoribrevibacter euphylliae TaxID=1834034 RepID=A0ABV7HKV5_9GAMM